MFDLFPSLSLSPSPSLLPPCPPSSLHHSLFSFSGSVSSHRSLNLLVLVALLPVFACALAITPALALLYLLLWALALCLLQCPARLLPFAWRHGLRAGLRWMALRASAWHHETNFGVDCCCCCPSACASESVGEFQERMERVRRREEMGLVRGEVSGGGWKEGLWVADEEEAGSAGARADTPAPRRLSREEEAALDRLRDVTHWQGPRG